MKRELTLMAGAVSFAFAVAGVQAQQQEQQPSPVISGGTFERLDTNNDGVVSRSESLADPQLSNQFDAFDQDGDGRVTREEVESYGKRE